MKVQSLLRKLAGNDLVGWFSQSSTDNPKVLLSQAEQLMRDLLDDLSAWSENTGMHEGEHESIVREYVAIFDSFYNPRMDGV